MSAGRSADGLVPAGQALLLIRLVEAHPDGIPEEQLLRDLSGAVGGSWSRARNTIGKLVGYGLIARTGGKLLPTEPNLPEAELRIALGNQVASDLLRRIASNGAWGCLSLTPDGANITIDMMALPATEDGIRLWLAEFGVLQRERIESRHWLVAPQRRDAFISAAALNAESTRRAKSAAQLAKELADQAAIGRAAEEWVVQYEVRRLALHPLKKEIRRISDDDVGAGYDISSFSSASSLHHDLFIEVKAHGANKRFHWSRNEIATALEFGEAYALYLIDIGRFDEAAYEPHIIRGPTPELFCSEMSGWRVEATSFECMEVEP